jgi:serine/threonine protein kinase
MNVDRPNDEAVGSELEDYLESRRNGEPVAEASAGELRALKAVVDRLDGLAQLARSGWGDDNKVPEFLGKYEIVRCIGRGGQSYAFLATDPDLQRQVVIKYYHSSAAETAREAVLTEGRSLARVASPHVVSCYAVERHNDIPYLVLERVCGRNLTETLAEASITVREGASLIAKVADGLANVHALGLLHRDIKPANIIVDNDGNPTLVDFGLATLEAGTVSPLRQGTVAYMSPEQARGEWERVDQRSDIFSLGAVLYEVLSGRPIYSAKTKTELLKQAQECQITPLDTRSRRIPTAVAGLCMRCLAENPMHRPLSAADLATQLRPHSQPSNRLQKGLLVAALIAAIVFGVYYLPLAFEGEPAARPDLPTIQSPAFAHDWNEIRQMIRSNEIPTGEQLGLRSDFETVLAVDGQTIRAVQTLSFRERDEVSCYFHSERTCHLAIYSIEFGSDSLKTVQRLFPDDVSEDSTVLAGASIEIPAFEAQPAEGFEMLYVIASTEPLDLSPRPELLDTTASLNEWDDEIRGLRRLRRLSEQIVPYVVSPREVGK